MARGGSKVHRAKATGSRTDEEWILRQNALVGELWKLDRMLGVRNVIIQRLREHLTPEEKELLAT